MSSDNQDWLSAASDNRQLSNTELDLLLQQPELQQKLERYQLAAAVFRRENAAPLPTDFAADIAALLQDEPTYQLSHSRTLLQKVGAGLSAAANGSWLKPAAQGAVAASVALFAVLGVQQYQQPAGQDLMLPSPVLQTNPIGGFATPVSLSSTTVDSRFAEQEQQAMQEQQRRLQALLQAHRQQVRVTEQQHAKTEQQNEQDNEQ
ncbi:MAG: anti-anti-sigma factor [Rheinheimera sp.]|uniref:sigma-E factor negative regulatory protein n=1 Tax=Arsukibacterium sp. UBA3155 TaxID=1946058 RepID=UPI000C8B2B92|nr:anti sigma-E factor RseA C-terminal domain-containing protein [Arsukibacterium sp. UBA3155]MAD74195.1 anti-anti-sigma factor [Rheinheimera sp.]|tara:strand:+ start:128726 stop:129340 length:615 start_codon:yes stop_codon:yes gene_type:complete